MFKFLIIIILSNFFLTACAAEQLNLTKIKDPTERLYVTGLSFLPPHGGDWHYQKINPYKITLGKLANSEINSFVGLVITHKIPEIKSEEETDFLKMVSSERWKDKNNESRFKTILNEETISHEKEEICVRFHTKLEDHGSKYLSQDIPYFILEDIGLVCRHPSDKNVGVTVGLSLRMGPEDYMNNFPELANSFLETTHFEPLNYDEATYYSHRAMIFYEEKQYGKSISSLQKVIDLNPNDSYVLNNLAWVLATCIDPKYRDGVKAIQLAKKALEINNHPNILDTLAAAYAENGSFDKAQKTQQKAIELYRKKEDNNQIAKANVRLEAYQMEKPWRDFPKEN